MTKEDEGQYSTVVMSESLHVPSLQVNIGGHSSDDAENQSTRRRLSRSPHPYHRSQQRGDLIAGAEENRSAEQLEAGIVGHSKPGFDNSSTVSHGRWRRKASTSPDDSGTEADDESFTFLRGLPAPPLKPRKGLRVQENSAGETPSPLLTPSYLDTYSKKSIPEYLNADCNGKISSKESKHKDGSEIPKKVQRRRRAELARRVVEIVLVGAIGSVVIQGQGVFSSAWTQHKGQIIIYTAIVALLTLFHCLRLAVYTWTRSEYNDRPWSKRVRIPSTFDPAPVLYPITIPIQVTLSLLPSQQHMLSPNILLSLSAIPDQLIPGFQTSLDCNVIHWAIAASPFLWSEISKVNEFNRLASETRQAAVQDRETMIILFPLFQALSGVLRYLTTTSLLSAELGLLSIALINLLIHSTSPQALILNALLWGGGVSILILCTHVIRWGVALARIPRWRFRKTRRTPNAGNFLSRLLSEKVESEDDSDGDVSLSIRPIRRKMSIQLSNSNGCIENIAKDPGSHADTGVHLPKSDQLESDAFATGPKHRRNTMPDTGKPQSILNGISRIRGRRKRSDMSAVQSYISLTASQANTRRWLYAGYVYFVIVATIMVGIRPYVGIHALNGAEPVGWALGYLFGNIPDFRFWVVANSLERWICLPRILEPSESCLYSRIELVRHHSVGEANTRLFICLYCIGVLATGLAIVFRLSSVVEVDTRRKVFHGMMVVMFLPCTFIDPVFTSLALELILAIFLLLDLIRASQLPPLSKPLAYFLTPYVDGRDLRGPVVVSHIFLLIGCAIPLWLSLAALPRSGEGWWTGWDIETRDASMISGVVCVGMGDAAASLIGRRYGRRKWPWSGGKSLEGSAAFTAAVAIGLAIGKFWGVFGGWIAPGSFRFGKMLLAGAGASLMEAVLTGGNDNVIVPIVLWLLVRGLQI